MAEIGKGVMLTVTQREMCSQTYKFNFKLSKKVSLHEQVRSFKGKIGELEEVALLLIPPIVEAVL